MSHNYRRDTHWLDAIPDFILIEWVRDYIADENPEQYEIKQSLYKVYNATRDRRIQHRLNGVVDEIQRQDEVIVIDRILHDEFEMKKKEADKDKKKEQKADRSYLAFDELTPISYITKQVALVNTADYQDLRKKFNNAVHKFLQNKSMKSLKEEWEDENCCIDASGKEILDKCQCVKRIEVVLWIYDLLMKNNKLWGKVPIAPLVTYQADINKTDIKYGHQQIFNDFLHIKLFHVNDDVDQNKITSSVLHDHFKLLYQCKEISECPAFERHYRDRGDVDKETKMFYIYEAEDIKSEKQKQMRRDIDLIFQEECDKIHCFFLHSTVQLANELNEAEEKKANVVVDTINAKGLGRSWVPKEETKDETKEETKEETKKEQNENTEPPKQATTRKGYVGKKEDEAWLEKLNNEDEEIDYKLLVKYMGVFRWQSAHGFRTGQNRGLVHLKPKFKNVKEEALENTYQRASKDNWNQTLRKSKIFYKSFASQRIKTLYPGSFDDDVSDTHITWKKGEQIALNEVVMLKLYTDFDKLQHELKKCFRWETIVAVLHKMEKEQKEDADDDDDDQIDNDNEVDDVENKDNKIKKKMVEETVNYDKEKRNELENRLREFFHWRVGLLIVLNKYGKKINEKSMVLYHGVNAKMILNPAETMAFYGPLSTTSSYHVAKTFATAKGMVLQITSQYPKLDFCRAFDASVISDYPEEQEFLIGFVYMRVLEIRTRPIINDIRNKEMWAKAPLASKMRVLFFSVHLFREQMFSMSTHLEYYLVEFLKCNELKCCEKSEFRSNPSPSIKQSFLSFLCCKIATHPKALTVLKDWVKKDQKEEKIMKILWAKFNDFRETPNLKQVVKIDTISKGLKPFFLQANKENVYGSVNYTVSFEKLFSVFPNVEEVHYINNYRFDNEILQSLIDVLKKHKRDKISKMNLKKIAFLYYEYDGDGDFPTVGDKFFHPKDLNKEKTEQLTTDYGWIIKYGKIGNRKQIGFKIRLYYKTNQISSAKSE